MNQPAHITMDKNGRVDRVTLTHYEKSVIGWAKTQPLDRWKPMPIKAVDCGVYAVRLEDGRVMGYELTREDENEDRSQEYLDAAAARMMDLAHKTFGSKPYAWIMLGD